MPVTVRTENGTDTHPRADRWDVSEHGGLWVKAGDSIIAEYPPGAWYLVRDDEPQDGVPDEGQSEEPVAAPDWPLLTSSRVTDLCGVSYDLNTVRHIGSGNYVFTGRVAGSRRR